MPKDAQAGKTLVSVTLPSTTTPGDPPIQGYLMALTLEEPSGLFEMPDLSGSVQFPDDDDGAGHDATRSTRRQPDGNEGWYAGPVRVTLTATDEQGGSGVEQMMYRIDGGPPQTYGGPFDYAVDGEHTLEYRSVDGAGNAEAYKPVTLKVDVNAPTTTATAEPGRAARHRRLVRRRRRGDAHGARRGRAPARAATEYRLDGGDWQPYGEPVVDRATAGVHDLEFRSTGRRRQRGDRPHRCASRSTAPRRSRRPGSTAPRRRPSTPAPSASAFIRTDGDGSGVVSTEYRIGDGAWTAYTGAFDVDGNRRAPGRLPLARSRRQRRELPVGRRS